MKSDTGFTLLELMVTLAIVGIIAAMAAPSFKSSIERNSLENERDILAAHLRFAKSSALQEGAAVICVSADKTSCSGSGQWEDGWIVFVNGDSDTTSYSSSSDRLLKVYEGIKDGHSLAWSGGESEVIFDNTGAFTPSGGGTFTFCGTDGITSLAKAWIIYGPGSMRRGLDTNNNGVRENIDGVDLSCP